MAPTRTCVGCRRTGPSDQLIRVTRTADGSLVVGRGRPGRGAWLCRDSPECVERAAKRSVFDRAFRSRVEDGEVDRLRTALGCRPGGNAGQGSEGQAP
ncbi:MAG: YlxR family protein [Acidimicrobiales bacterium]|nr:YlxR family protein [Acidimicrobiales bacterium]